MSSHKKEEKHQANSLECACETGNTGFWGVMPGMTILGDHSLVPKRTSTTQ